MNCDEVRVLLAAYRRSEWSEEDQHTVNTHLVSCAECRRWEAQARGVGEQLRQMPTIVPPPSLRANVFAIIRQEELARATQAAETARPATPAPATPAKLPVPPRPVILTRPTNLPARPTIATAAPPARIGELAIGSARPPRILFGRTTAIATIAAAFVLLFAAQLTPLFNVHVSPNNNLVAVYQSQAKPASFVAAPDPAYSKVSSVYANLKDVFFVGQTADGKSMLFSQDRLTNQTKALLATSTSATITIYGLSDTLLVWQETTDTSWMLKGLALTDSTTAQTATPMILATHGQSFGNSTLTKIISYWLDGQSLLFTALDTHGATILERADVSANTVTYTFVTQAQSGHSLTSPYLDGANAYWVDRVTASDGTQVGTLWTAASGKAPQVVGIAANVLGPVASGDALAWFQPATTAEPNSASIDNGLTPALSGSIVTRDSAGGQPHTLSTGTVLPTNVVRGGGYILWRDDAGLHAYRLDTKELIDAKLLPIAPALNGLSISSTSAAWSTTATQGANTTTTIQVVDIRVS